MFSPSSWPSTRRAAAVLCAGFLAAIAHAQTALTVAYTPSNSFLPAFVAKEQGFFAKHGLDVTLTMIPIISTLPAALESGSVQVASLALPNMLLANEGGLDLKVVAGGVIQSKQNPTGGLLARTDLPIQTPANMVGKRAAVPGINGYMHIALMRWLEAGGVPRNKVTYVEMSFPQMGDQLRAKQIDAAVATQPFLGRIEESGNGRLVSKITGEGEPHFDVAYVVTGKFARQNPALPKAFKESIAQAIEWIAKNEGAARSYQVSYLKLPKAVADTIPLPTYRVEFGAKDLQWWSDVMLSLGLTTQPASPGALVQ